MNLKIEDTFLLGIFSGFFANIFKTILDLTLYVTGFKEHPMWHLATSVYFPKTSIQTIPGLIVGIFTDFAVAILLGIITVYLLFYTSMKGYIIKGMAVGLLAWLFAFGVVLQSGLAEIIPEEPLTNLCFLCGHLVIGLLIPILIKKYGDLST